MALSYGVSYFTGEEIRDHECTEACKEEDPERKVFHVPCLRCLGRGCKACSHGYTALDGCPYGRDLEDAAEYLALHAVYPGAFPFSGGLYDQPAVYVTAMRLLDRAKELLKEAYMSAQEKKNG